MSNTARIAATAANTLTKPLNVEDVFSTYLYTGTGSTKTITNGIDLSGEGGLVWSKARSQAYPNAFFDTERGALKYLDSGSTSAEITGTNNLTAFNSNGFTLGADSNWAINKSGTDYCTWTFRKAPKFFDVVTYTGDGTSSRAISHSLGSTPGCIIIKRTDASAAWTIFHRGLSGGITGSRILFDTSAATSGSNITAVDNSTFTVISTGTNNSGGTYVAYLFAHNNGDGDFGDGTQDIIKCGSYTGNSSGVEIDLGFEPQWFLCKKTNGIADWQIFDVMRGMHFNTVTQSVRLSPNTNGAETSQLIIGPSPTGVSIPDASDSVNINSGTYIYIAIRRGPMAVPESATDVFDIATRDGTEPGFDSSFPVDFALTRTVNTADNWWAASRLNQGKYLQTNGTNAEASASSLQFDYMDGWNANAGVSSTLYSWMWKRAPNYFDVVAYTGNGTAGRTVSHNLGVAPEMIWVKVRNLSSGWPVWHTGKELYLNSTAAKEANPLSFNNTDPTNTSFTLNSYNSVNGSGYNYIAYLFASLDGISKVGSFTYTQGVAQNIDCGFSSGARFVLYKRTSGTSGWTVFDTERGIVAGNDPMLFLNSTAAETSSYDFIDPYSGGFALSDSTANLSGDYIFYAIA